MFHFDESSSSLAKWKKRRPREASSQCCAAGFVEVSRLVTLTFHEHFCPLHTDEVRSCENGRLVLQETKMNADEIFSR